MGNRSSINLKFNGEIFKNINEVIKKEKGQSEIGLISASKMADIYMEVFKANNDIKLISKESYGNLIVDDNHVQIIWKVRGSSIEFYYEESWGIIELSIDEENRELLINEIVKAFENYYQKKLCFKCERIKVEEGDYMYNIEIYV